MEYGNGLTIFDVVNNFKGGDIILKGVTALNIKIDRLQSTSVIHMEAQYVYLFRQFVGAE